MTYQPKSAGEMADFESLTLCIGPFTRSDFKDPTLGSEFESRRSSGPISRVRFCHENVGRSFANKKSLIWRQNDHRNIMQNLSAPFIFQEECRMKIEHVLFPSVFFKITDPCVGRSEPTNRILKNKIV